ncbi:MAG: hypothetical protein SFT92_05800 [Rickettsiales bacterium]|nr:hypothetical protein [Rickettsiales bacterium]
MRELVHKAGSAWLATQNLQQKGPLTEARDIVRQHENTQDMRKALEETQGLLR